MVWVELVMQWENMMLPIHFIIFLIKYLAMKQNKKKNNFFQIGEKLFLCVILGIGEQYTYQQ